MEVIHTAIWVSDMDEAREFYIDALGLEENWSFSFEGIENVYVGREHGEIQLRYDPDHPAPAPDRTDYDHIGIEVEDTDAVCDRLVEETGCTVLRGPMDVDAADARVAFIEAPDGYVLELVQHGS